MGGGVWLQKPLIHPWLLIRAHLITLLSEPEVVMGNFRRTLKWVQVSLLMSWRKKRSYKCTTAHRHTHTTWTHVTRHTCPPLAHVHITCLYSEHLQSPCHGVVQWETFPPLALRGLYCDGNQTSLAANSHHFLPFRTAPSPHLPPSLSLSQHWLLAVMNFWS